MEEQNIMEQPPSSLDMQGNVEEQILNENAPQKSDNENGSTFGKFKDATSLLEAYNNLQSEFTRKSQQLAKFLKTQSKVEDDGIAQTTTANHNSKNEQMTNENQIDDISKSNDISLDKDINKTNQEDFQHMPTYKNKNWHSQVVQFFEINPEAKSFAKEISSLIMKDKTLANCDGCLDYAYRIVSHQKQVKPAELLNNPEYVQQIVENESIQEKIISQYLQNVLNSKNNLKFITGEAKDISPTPPSNKPKNLKEASNMLRKILQS